MRKHINSLKDQIFKRNKRGFTIMEITIALGVISMITTIMLPGFQHMKMDVNEIKVIQHLRGVQQDMTNRFNQQGFFPADLDNLDPTNIYEYSITASLNAITVLGYQREGYIFLPNNGSYEIEYCPSLLESFFAGDECFFLDVFGIRRIPWIAGTPLWDDGGVSLNIIAGEFGVTEFLVEDFINGDLTLDQVAQAIAEYQLKRAIDSHVFFNPAGPMFLWSYFQCWTDASCGPTDLPSELYFFHSQSTVDAWENEILPLVFEKLETQGVTIRVGEHTQAELEAANTVGVNYASHKSAQEGNFGSPTVKNYAFSWDIGEDTIDTWDEAAARKIWQF